MATAPTSSNPAPVVVSPTDDEASASAHGPEDPVRIASKTAVRAAIERFAKDHTDLIKDLAK